MHAYVCRLARREMELKAAEREIDELRQTVGRLREELAERDGEEQRCVCDFVFLGYILHFCGLFLAIFFRVDQGQKHLQYT